MTYENEKEIRTVIKSGVEMSWRYVSMYQNLSEKFIREFKDKVNWYRISENQNLSEKFIREFKDKVNWYSVFRFQKLSEKFIREFKDKVDWYYISNYQNLSNKFREEFNIQPQPVIITAEEYAKEYKLEIKDGYLYAYRDHNFNGSGIFRKNIYYRKGKYYKDWHCDLNPIN